MKVQDVIDRVEQVKHYAFDKDDDEIAHIREDDLWLDVLKAIMVRLMSAATITHKVSTSLEALEYISSQHRLATEHNMVLDYLEVKPVKQGFLIILRFKS